jgi:hypothetical protein
MSLRFRRTVGLGKLARLNVSKSGLSLSLGVPGLRFNVPVVGTRRRKPNATLGIPGTGLSYNFSLANDNSRRKANQEEYPQFEAGQYKEFKAYNLQKLAEFKKETETLEAKAWDEVRKEGLADMPAILRLKMEANRADLAKFEAWVNGLPDEAPKKVVDVTPEQFIEVAGRPPQSAGKLFLQTFLVGAVFALFLIILFAAMAASNSARSQTSSFFDKNGSFAGSSVRTSPSSQSFFDKSGRFEGTTKTIGNQTIIYDKNGHFQGSMFNYGKEKR